MGASKILDYSERQLLLAKYAKALSHPARIAILEVLLKRQSCICGDIVEELPIAQSTVSQHLKELKEAGLIKGSIEGVTVCYCIDEKSWANASQFLQVIFGEFQSMKSTCC
jgi:DNA-binding transcriptional ArsR family regulator